MPPGGKLERFARYRILPTLKFDRACYLEIMLAYHRVATTPYKTTDQTVADHLIPNLPDYGVMHPSLAQRKASAVASKTRIRMTRIGLAILRHHQKTGSTPESLNILGDVAKLTDPFSGEAFVYRNDDSGTVLYSVGKNQIDDGGFKHHTKVADDIVWRFH